jgi:hypothetical protein
MQLEFGGHPLELVGCRVVEAHPYERVVVLPARLQRVLEVEDARLAFAAGVRGAVHDHTTIVAQRWRHGPHAVPDAHPR